MKNISRGCIVRRRKNECVAQVFLNALRSIRVTSRLFYSLWTCTARVESRKRKPKAEKREGSFQDYQGRLCAPMNGVCKITIALAGLESRGRERNADGIRGIILTFVKAKKQEIYMHLISALAKYVKRLILVN